MKDEGTVTGSPIFTHTGDELHLLREVYRTNQALFNNLSRVAGVSGSRLTLIRLLAVEMPEGGGIMEIARRLGINAAAVTRLVKEMEEQKWVKRRADAADGRRSHISLTIKGRNRVRRIHERLHEFERSLTERMEARDIETAIRVLSVVRTALEQFREKRPI